MKNKEKMKNFNIGSKTMCNMFSKLNDEELDNVVGGQNGRSMMKVAESSVDSTASLLQPLKQK